jgi:hypothetical protein
VQYGVEVVPPSAEQPACSTKITSPGVAQWPSGRQIFGSGHSSSVAQARHVCAAQIGELAFLAEQCSFMRH